MNEEKIRQYRQRLLAKRRQLCNLIGNIEKSGLDLPLEESIGELSTYDNHPADIGDEIYERSKDISLRENARIELGEVNKALEAVENGTYGKCRLCGREIDEKRLSVLPETTLCIECSKFEREYNVRLRPIEEEVVAPPFGGFYHDNSAGELGDSEDEQMYDGEDAWQEVDRFGSSDTPQDQPESIRYPQVWLDQDEDRGSVEDVDSIPYTKGKNGMIYKNERAQDDESGPVKT